MTPISASRERYNTDSLGQQEGKNYEFYTFPNDPPQFYQEKLLKATESIEIWDPYFDIASAKLFEVVEQNGIKINILTRYLCDKQIDASCKIQEFKDAIIKALRKHSVRDYHLSIKCNYCDFQAKVWHDRYLIIDNKDVYLVGTSIKEMINPRKSFGMYHVDNELDSAFIISKKEECYNSCINNINSVSTRYGKRITQDV